MRKKSIRLASAALAACMMLSVLPVGAFALEPDAETENSVSVQAENATRLNGGETITDDNITSDGVYYMDDASDYAQGIIIDTSKEVIININSDIVYTGTDTFLKVTSAKVLTVNNSDNHEFKAESAAAEKDFLRVESDGVVAKVNGGIYQMGFSQAGKSEMTLQKVTASEKYGNALNNHIGTMTVVGGKYSNTNVAGGRQPTAINNEDGTLTFRNAEVTGEQYGAIINVSGTTTIYGGEYSSCKNVIYENGGRVEIYGGHFSSTGSNPTIAIASDNSSGDPVTDAQLIVHAGTFEKEQGGQIFANWGELTIDDDGGETLINNPSGTSATVMSYNKLYFKGGTITSPESRAISVATNKPSSIPAYAEITGGTIKNSKYGIHVSRNNATVILENVTFENNENDIYLGDGQKITIKDSFKDPATVKCADAYSGRQITTADTDGQQNLKLTSNDGYLVAYNEAGNFRYLTEKTAGKYTVTTENSTATADLGSGEETLYPYTEIDANTNIDLKADPAPDGEAFDGWDVLVDDLPNDSLLDDNDAEETHFVMPAGNVTIRAKYKTVIDPVDPSGSDDIKGALSTIVVIGTAGVLAYETGTGIYRVLNMPGIILPSNRIELADLIWERAGKPEPENTDLYDDIDEDDTDWQKAARWMVEQELMDDDVDEEKDTENFHPYRMVTKLRVCLTWQKAKDKGLFDNTETKAE